MRPSIPPARSPALPPSFSHLVLLSRRHSQETAAFAAATLLSNIAHKRRDALRSGDMDLVYDALVVEARVCMLRQLYVAAVTALQRAARLPGRNEDAQLVCLEVSARNDLLQWQDSSSASYSSSDYYARYKKLAGTLHRLASGGGPPPSQCIAPFATLVSPLDPALIRLVAASAALREEQANAAQVLTCIYTEFHTHIWYLLILSHIFVFFFVFVWVAGIPSMVAPIIRPIVPHHPV